MGQNDDNSSDNFFVRFKHRVDANVSTAYKSVAGDPPATATSSPSSDTMSAQQPTADNKMEDFAREARFDATVANILLSEYSPFYLRRLRQPVPADALPNMDSSIFTFEDAFEDLLAVSRGMELPQITDRYDQRRLLRSMFPTGEPLQFWTERLRSQGLLQRPDPGHVFGMIRGPSWTHFHEELEKNGVWREFADRRRWLEEQNPWFRDRNPEDHWVDKPGNRRREPNDFDEFFSSFRSFFSDGDNSWNTFMKTINENDRKPGQPMHRQTEGQLVDKEEYVDRFGFKHSKAKYKIVDDEGNQVGTSTHYSFSSGDETSDKPKHQHDDGDEEQKKGWFWK